MTLTHTGGFRSYDVIGRRDEARNVVTFTLSAPASGARAGHHLIVAAPLDGDLRREYSLSAIAPDAVEITVKREGRVSTWLHEAIHPGDVLMGSSPRGSFVLSDRDVPLVLLSCGIGITPMVAMAQEAVRRDREVHFVHAARDRAHHALRAHLEHLQREHKFISHLTYKYGTDPSECDHLGEFTVDQLRDMLPAGEVEVKICGPGHFMQAMCDAAVDLGVPPESIAWEAFGPSTMATTTARRQPPDVAADSTAMQVTFSESNVTATWDSDSHNLLDFAEEQGVYPNYSCRQGSCRSCMTRVTNGDFEYVSEPFETPEKGFVLLCCSRPLSDIELAL